jgi:hypothetical protein
MFKIGDVVTLTKRIGWVEKGSTFLIEKIEILDKRVVNDKRFRRFTVLLLSPKIARGNGMSVFCWDRLILIDYEESFKKIKISKEKMVEYENRSFVGRL